jgi:TnpA family transposase
MVSLKLGKTTAFQVLKRMNSYAKRNPLQKAFKEFGKIIRTAFILGYYDDLELRQSIEKQLGHMEMMNRFAKAVFFGNNQEFQVATKQEQEKSFCAGGSFRTQSYFGTTCTCQSYLLR